MQRLLPMLSMIILLTSCDSNGPCNGESQPTTEGYATLSVALACFTDTQVDSVLLVDKAMGRPFARKLAQSNRAYIKKHLPALLDETINSLIANEYAVALDPEAFGCPPHVRLISQAEIEELVTNDPVDSWSNLFELYDGYRGYFWAAEVGINRSRDQALVYLDYACGLRCGEDAFLLLSKINGVWKCEDKLTMGVS